MANTLLPIKRKSSDTRLRPVARGVKVGTGLGSLTLLAGAAVAACGGAASAPPAHNTATTVAQHGSTTVAQQAGTSSTGTVASQTSGAPATTPQVGAGWSLALMYPKGAKDSTLVLINPTGSRRDVTSSLPLDANIDGWSGDGQRALITASIGGGTTQVTEVDLANGAVLHQFSSTSASGAYVYSEPDGLAMLQNQSETNGSLVLVRENLSGSVELTYPRIFPGSRRPTPHTEPDYIGSYLETPDGTEIVMGANLGMAVVSNSGAIIRSLYVPNTTACSPIEWWTPGVALSSCDTYAGVPQYWLVPDSGAAPSRFGPVPSSATNVYSAGGNDYANADDVCSAVRVLDNGVWKIADVPGGSGNGANSVIGSYNGELELITSTCHGSTVSDYSLEMYNPSTHATLQLLTGSTDAMLFPVAG